MMRKKWNRTATRAAACAAALLVLGACTSTTDAEEHREAVGMVVLDEATNAVLVTVNAQRQVTGSLSVARGQERAIEVLFVDEAGTRFEPDGDDHTLGFSVANTAIATLEEHEGHLDLAGVSAGTTTALFSIRHGSHSDYDSPAVPVTVTP